MRTEDGPKARRLRSTPPLGWTTIRHRLAAAVLAALLSAWAANAEASPLTAVISDPGNIEIKLEPVVTLSGFVPIDTATIPGDPKLYVGTYLANSASVRIVDPVTKTISPTPFLTFAGTGVPITGFGLQGITFSPNFNDDTQPGYRKLYTFEVETGPGAGNIMYPHPEVAGPTEVVVLREWTANAAGTAVDTSIPSRVVLNYGGPSFNTHNGGGLKFGPDGYLYLATGDGGGNGNGNGTTGPADGFTGRDASGSSMDVPGISNGQDFTNMLGKLIRIDPYVTNADGSPRPTPDGSTAKEFGGSTRYFIPDSNPFVGNPQNIYFTPIGPVGSQTPVAPLEELYAFGFRNPWKLSFDKNAEAGDAPYVADVGSRQREEIVLVEPGQNHGWPYREGELEAQGAGSRPLVSGNLPFLKQTSPGVFAQFDLDPALSNPTQMPLPIAMLGTRSGTGGPIRFYDRPPPGTDLFNDGIYGNEWGDTSSVVGGFVYRGTAIPELEGMYIFGGYQYLILDPDEDPEDFFAVSDGGRLYYFDPNEAATYKTIREFNLEAGFGIPNMQVGTSNIGDLLSVSQGDDGELYAMFANGDIKLLAPPTLVGDYNGDGVVDAGDYVRWRNNLGGPEESLLNRDPENDGVIDLDDYASWKLHYGDTRDNPGGGGLAHSGTVPEPTALALAALGALAMSMRRRGGPSS